MRWGCGQLTQDEGGETIRTLYDGTSFERIREGPSYRDGQLTTRSAQGPVQSGGIANNTIQSGAIQSGTADPGATHSNTATGERYRWISEGQEGRTRSTDTATQSRTGRYEGISVTLYGKGEAVSVSRSASAGVRGGSVYLGTDILGSVRSATGEAGTLEDRYEYDAFGRPYKGDLDAGMNLGYTGKPYDSRTGLYNYGYRDYEPATARFTTVDPVRDGNNWFAYVNNDPVNYTDPWGLSASDGGRDTEEDDSTYTAQTVQYRQDIVYYYEIQTISSPMAQLLPDIKYQTRYSYDSNAITADKNSLVSDLKDADFIQSSQNRRVFYYANTKTSEVVNIMIGETQQAPSLPQSLKSPKQGEVLRTPGRSTENGFSR